VPLRLRETCDGLTVVASAFGPLGGDRTSLELVVGEGAQLAVGSAAAQVAQPGVHDPVSRADVRIEVRDGADLRWLPEPLVVTSGAEHRLVLDVEVSPSATAVLARDRGAGQDDRPARPRPLVVAGGPAPDARCWRASSTSDRVPRPAGTARP
jgi:urease accessory protein